MKETPNFVGEGELRNIGALHGDNPDLVQAVIDAKLISKDDACRFWADGLNVAYVDPFVSVITDEAIEKIPLEVAKKTRAIGLYIFNGVMTVAMAAPDDVETVKRLGQIARVPVSPVFALPREIDDSIAIHYSTEERIEDSLSDVKFYRGKGCPKCRGTGYKGRVAIHEDVYKRQRKRRASPSPFRETRRVIRRGSFLGAP